jgi:hypothetical protein
MIRQDCRLYIVNSLPVYVVSIFESDKARINERKSTSRNLAMGGNQGDLELSQLSSQFDLEKKKSVNLGIEVEYKQIDCLAWRRRDIRVERLCVWGESKDGERTRRCSDEQGKRRLLFWRSENLTMTFQSRPVGQMH